MPRFRDKEDRRLAKAIEGWQLEAVEAVNDIEGWRDATDYRWQYTGDPRREWPNPPANLFGDTSYLVGQIIAHSRKLDPTPIQEIYDAINAWHTDHHAARIPPDNILRSTLDQAMVVLLAIESAIRSRLIDDAADESDLDESQEADKQLAERILRGFALVNQEAKKTSRRGPKRKYDPVQDRRIWAANETGQYPTYEDLGRKFELTAKQVEQAIDRHRHR